MTLSATKTHQWLGRGILCGLTALAAACAIFSTCATARAQFSVRELIGDYVTDYSDPQYRDVENAIIAFRNNDVDEARKRLETAVKNNPALSPPEVMLARLFFAANQLPQGRGELEKAVANSPDDPEAYIVLADILVRQGWGTAADLAFAKGNELCQKYTRNRRRQRNLQIRALAGLAMVAEGRGQWKDAENYLTEWIKIDPENATAHSRKARALFRQGGDKNYSAAYQVFQDYYKNYAKNNENLPRPEISMAMLYLGADEKEIPEAKAIAKNLMLKAVERDGDNLRTRLAVAQWAIGAGELRTARENADAARKLDKTSAGAKMVSGLVARYEKDYETAEALFRQIHTESPTNFAANNHLALSLVAQSDEKKRAEALAYAQLNARLNNDSKQTNAREAAVTLGWVLFQLGQEANGLRIIQQVVNAGPVSPESTYFIAKMLDRKPEIALKILQPVIESKRPFPERADGVKLLEKLKKIGAGQGGDNSK